MSCSARLLRPPVQSHPATADPLLKYIEIDFPHITSRKARRIVSNSTLSSALSRLPPSNGQKAYTISQGGMRLDSEMYALIPLDLRQNLPPIPTESNPHPVHPLTKHLLPLLDPTIPTLFLAECLFCYMPPSASASVIDWFGSVFSRPAGPGGPEGGGCMGVVYEMCGLE
jgi:[phosphatase 2A protein]-leucine-carboxy methyltransferase